MQSSFANQICHVHVQMSLHGLKFFRRRPFFLHLLASCTCITSEIELRRSAVTFDALTRKNNYTAEWLLEILIGSFWSYAISTFGCDSPLRSLNLNPFKRSPYCLSKLFFLVARRAYWRITVCLSVDRSLRYTRKRQCQWEFWGRKQTLRWNLLPLRLQKALPFVVLAPILSRRKNCSSGSMWRR